MARMTPAERAALKQRNAEITAALANLPASEPATASEPITPSAIKNERWFPLGGVWIQVKSHRQEEYFKREFPTHPSYGKTSVKTIGLSGSYYKVGPEDFEKLRTSFYRKHFTEMVRMNESLLEMRWSTKG